MIRKIPIILITGFLGSGKTTLINTILEKLPDHKISVLLNEFGDIKLESQFVKKKDGDVLELTNGCMCCVAQTDFAHAIRWVMTEKPETEYLIMEASGLSDPMPIVEVLTQSDIKEHIELSTIVCMVDAMHFEEMKQVYQTILQQVSCSDMIVVSKIEEAGIDKTARVKRFVEKFMPRVSVFDFDKDLNVSLFFDTTPTYHEILLQQVFARSGHEHSHEHDQVDSYIWRSESVLDFDKVNTFLRRLPAHIIRAKGIMAIADGGVTKKFLLQYVGARSDVFESEWGNDERRENVLLFLGKKIDESILKKSLESCIL